MITLAIMLALVVGVYVLARCLKTRNSVRLSPLPDVFIVADLETTGLDPENDEIIEIAAIRAHRDSKVHETFSALVRPTKRVSKKISRMTGISQEMLDSEGESLESVVQQFIEFIGPLRLVFYNAPFDLAFLRKAAARARRELSNPVSDALEMARRAYPGLRSYRLETLAKMGGFDASGAHRALADCEMALTVYCAAALKLRRVS